MHTAYDVEGLHRLGLMFNFLLQKKQHINCWSH